nr:unnamed protein product [Digitaria exilis]
MLSEAQERNEELLKKIHDNDKNILQLQFTIQRLEETTVANENLLSREREQNDATTKAHIESQEKYEELRKKFVDVDRKIDLLQGTIERLEDSVAAKDVSLEAALKENDTIRKSLIEAQERNDELLKKIADSFK